MRGGSDLGGRIREWWVRLLHGLLVLPKVHQANLGVHAQLHHDHPCQVGCLLYVVHSACRDMPEALYPRP